VETGETLNLILGLVKETAINDRAMREGFWQKNPSAGLAGKTLGLLGLGVIGQQMTQIAKAMRMRVIAWSPNPTPDRASANGAECVSFEKIFTDSDIVSLHAPLSPDNKGMVGEKELGMIRPHALLVNPVRAALIQEDALRKALEERKIAGAGFDVYGKKPLPADHWLCR
jgi:phosphoglycerate dehydrogenase-like enzyme